MSIKDISKRTIIYFLLIIVSFILLIFRSTMIIRIVSIILLCLNIVFLFKRNREYILIMCASLILFNTNYIDSILILSIYEIGIFIFNKLYDFYKIKYNKYMSISTDVEILRGKKIINLKVDKVKKGDILTLDKNNILLFDGVIVDGKTSVNVEYINNREDIKVLKKNNSITAGSFNVGDTVKIRITTRYKDTKFYKLYSILLDRLGEESRFEKIIRYLTYAISFISIIMYIIIYFAFKNYFYLSELLIFIATSLIVFNYILKYVIDLGIIKLFYKNVLFKNRNGFLHSMRIKNIYFDKTGVITTGKLRVTKVIGIDKDKVLYYLNLGEVNSSSRIADAIINYKKINIGKVKIKNYEECQGRGIKYRVNSEDVLIGNYYFMKDNDVKIDRLNNIGTIIYITINKKILGSVIISDSIKKTNKKYIAKLAKIGIKNIVVLSGDNERIVSAVCNEVGVIDYYSNITQDEKMFWYKYLTNKYRGLSLYLSNYNHRDSSIDTDFNFSLDNNNLDFKNYDIISVDDDIRCIVRLMENALIFKDIIFKNIFIYLLSLIISILFLIFKVNYGFIYILINMIIMNIVIFTSSRY